MTKPTKHEPPGFEFGFISVAAYRKFTAPPTFSFFRVSSETGGTVLVGATSSGTRKSGKSKGRPKRDGTRQTVIVTAADIDAEERRYESETGHCAQCVGSGQGWAGWSLEGGNRYRDCSICKGTGNACTK